MNFDHLFGDYARPLPAPNLNFAEFAQKPVTPALVARLPAGIKPVDLNFLDTSSTLFCWPHILYTAAFAVGKNPDNIVTKRNLLSSTAGFVLGDSGGFSLISGAIKASISSWRAATLKWQEQVCDGGLPVDFPTSAIGRPGIAVSTPKDCLDFTIDNTKYALSHRTRSDFKLYAVYQGRTRREADAWTEAMGAYQPHCEGMAIAGGTRLNIHEWLPRIVDMKDRGLFDRVSAIHVLGTAQPRFAVLATALQRAIRKYWRDGFDVTFDSSTSFTFVQRFGQVVTGLEASRRDFRMTNHTMPNRGGEFNPLATFPYRSPLADLCKVGDFLPGTDPMRSPVDGVGNNMLSHHSVYSELSAILQANRLMDMAQQDMSAMAPYGLSLAVQLIDEAVAGSGKALTDLALLMRKPENTIEPDTLERADN
jgi:hypothetical protein